MMQQPVNPALAQVLGAMNSIKPVTPQGTPTVAAQVMSAAQPNMQDMGQNAGIAANIEAHKMRQMQQAMESMAEQATQKPAGISDLNPGPMKFAEGGIVGYAEGGRAVAQPRATPSSEELFKRQREGIESLNVTPPTAADALPGARADRAAMDAYFREQGLPSEHERISNQGSQLAKITEDRLRLLQEREAAMKEREPRAALIDFLLGARGRGMGVFGAGAAASQQGQAARQSEVRSLQDMQLAVRTADVEKQSALSDMRAAIAKGDMAGAMSARERALNAENAKKSALAATYGDQAKTASQMEQALLGAETQRRGQDMQLEGQRLLATSRETSSGNTFYDRLERQANAAMDDFMKSGEGIKLAATNPAGLAQKRDQLKAKLVLEALQLGAKDIPPEAVEAAKKTLAPSAVAPGVNYRLTADEIVGLKNGPR